MNFQVPPLRPEGAKSTEPRTWLDEYLEGKDEILLYITAALGVLLPGFVFILYHKCHAYYERYAKKKEDEKLKEDLAQSEAAVIVLGDEEGQASKWAKIVHEKLSEEMVRKPMFWSSDSVNVKNVMDFKGFAIFFVDTMEGGKPTASSEWFLEWLEDLAADGKIKKKANFDKVRFSIVGFGSSGDGQFGYNKVSRTLLKRLKIVGSKQITEVELFDTLNIESKIIEKFGMYIIDLLDAMDRHLPGAENNSDFEGEEFEESTGEEDEDTEEEDDGEDENDSKMKKK